MSRTNHQIKATGPSKGYPKMDRGKPVGQLVPISRTQTPRDSLARKEKQALIKLGSGKLPKDFWKMPRAEDPQGLVFRALLEEREAGWKA